LTGIKPLMSRYHPAAAEQSTSLESPIHVGLSCRPTIPLLALCSAEVEGETIMATKTTHGSAALQPIRELLDHDRPGDALNLVTRSGNDSPEMKNARGVCLLRLGRLDEAISVLEEVAFRGLAGMSFDAPALFQVNFAIAMLRANRNKGGALQISDRLDGSEHPEAARLKDAVRRWKKSMGLLGIFGCRLGLYPAKPVPLDQRAGAV
jgi:hypothetical protein